MNKFWKILGAAALALSLPAANAGDLYVSLENGKNKNAGTKEEPLKNLWKALENAKPGDTIHLAAGQYPGKLKCNWFAVDRPVSIIGGYNADFSARDPLANPTLLQPLNENNDKTGSGQGILHIEFKGEFQKAAGFDMVLDGLIFDDGQASSFHAVNGKPEGVETGMWLEPPAKGNTPFPSRNRALLFGRMTSDNAGKITVRNCVFANGGNYAVLMTAGKGEIKFLNNVFVNNRMIACEVMNANRDPNTVNMEFANNTVLFTWTRTKTFEDMGFGVRANAKMNVNIHHNVIGLSCKTGFDNTKGDDKTKKISLDNNIFFLNKESDAQMTISPSIAKVRVDGFEDLEGSYGIESAADNVALKDPKAFAGKINQAYLEGFLAASYTEKTDLDENSPANVFREAMGLNKRGTITSKVSMFANRYPLDEVFKLFGAVAGTGAQAVGK